MQIDFQTLLSGLVTFKGTGNYTMSNETGVVVKKATGAATTVTLPLISADIPTGCIVVDGKGDAASNNITVQGASGQTIDGASTYVMSTAYQGAWFISNGTEWNILSVYGPAASGGAPATFTTLTLTGLLTESAIDAQTAVGTTQGTALALTKSFNNIGTTTASTPTFNGVSLPASAAGLGIVVINSAASPIQVYGAGSDTINGMTATTGITQMQESVVMYVCTAAGVWLGMGLGFGYGNGTGGSASLSTEFTMGGLTATGNSQGTALLLPAQINRITTVAASTGAILPANKVGLVIQVTNDGANTLTVYPDTGATINGLPANTGTLLPIGATAIFSCVAANVWKTLIAQPREVNTGLSTAGAGTPSAAGIVGGCITRTGGGGAAFTDTTDTGVNIIAALHGAAVGQSFEFTYINNTAFVATIAGGVGVTVSNLAGNTLTIAANTWARFLVTVATGTTVTMAIMAEGPNANLLPAQFTSINVTTGTLGAGKASGAAYVDLTSTNATPGVQAMRTVAQVLVDTPGLAVGSAYVLRVKNTGAGVFTLATDGSAQFTMTGTMTVLQNTYRDFLVTINSATTGTVQDIGSPADLITTQTVVYSGTIALVVPSCPVAKVVIPGVNGTSATFTLNCAAVAPAGQLLIVETTADGSGTVTGTFGTNFRTTGTQATTTTKISEIILIGDGTKWNEIARNTAMT